MTNMLSTILSQDETSSIDLDSLTSALAGEWHPHAIYPTELIWLAYNIKNIGATVLIECGSLNGYSSKWLHKILNIPIITIDFGNKSSISDLEYCLDSKVYNIKGNAHQILPKLLQLASLKKEKVVIFNDAPKGFEGLVLLTTNCQAKCVVGIAQHNLHIDHKSRASFLDLSHSGKNCFFETSILSDQFQSLTETENNILSCASLNRPKDSSSLGFIDLSSSQLKQRLRRVNITLALNYHSYSLFLIAPCLRQNLFLLTACRRIFNNDYFPGKR